MAEHKITKVHSKNTTWVCVQFVGLVGCCRPCEGCSLSRYMELPSWKVCSSTEEPSSKHRTINVQQTPMHVHMHILSIIVHVWCPYLSRLRLFTSIFPMFKKNTHGQLTIIVLQPLLWMVNLSFIPLIIDYSLNIMVIDGSMLVVWHWSSSLDFLSSRITVLCCVKAQIVLEEG